MSDSPPKDPLDNSVSLSASLDESKLNVAAKSRFAAAIDRLGGNVVDLANPFLERIAEKQRQKTRAVQEIAEAELSAALKEFEGDPTHGQRALVRLLKDSGRKLENLDAILVQSTEELKQLPPPTDDEVQDEREELDPDWMNAFEGYAVNASSEHLRTLWARVLAGEIRKPSSFSRSTLRFISEVDQEIATTFESKLKFLLDGYCIPLFGQLGHEDLKAFSFLQECGLVYGVGDDLGLPYKASEQRVVIVNRGLGLRHYVKSDFNFPIAPLTRVGREVAATIANAPSDQVLRRIASVYRHNLTNIELVRIVGGTPADVEVEVIETLS